MTSPCLWQHGRQSNALLFRKTVDDVLGAMRRADPLFDKAFRRVCFHTGSSRPASGTEAAGGGARDGNEVDAHVQLHLPIKAERVQTLKSKISKDWVHFKLTEALGETSMPWKGRGRLLPPLAALFDERKRMFLSRAKINQWAREVLRKAEEELRNGQHSEQVTFSSRQVAVGSDGVTVTSRIGQEVLRVNIIMAIEAPPIEPNRTKKKQPAAQTLSLLAKAPPPSLTADCDFADQLFRAFDPEGKDEGNGRRAKALQEAFKATTMDRKWSFIKAQYVKCLFVQQINGSPSDDEDSGFWNEIFEKMLVDLFDLVDMYELFFHVRFATEKINLCNIIMLATESPYSLAENILENFRDRVKVSRRNV